MKLNLRIQFLSKARNLPKLLEISTGVKNPDSSPGRVSLRQVQSSTTRHGSWQRRFPASRLTVLLAVDLSRKPLKSAQIPLINPATQEKAGRADASGKSFQPKGWIWQKPSGRAARSRSPRPTKTPPCKLGLQPGCPKVIPGHQRPPGQADVGEAKNVSLRRTAWKTSGKHHPARWLPSHGQAISVPEPQRGFAATPWQAEIRLGSVRHLPAPPAPRRAPFAEKTACSPGEPPSWVRALRQVVLPKDAEGDGRTSS